MLKLFLKTKCTFIIDFTLKKKLYYFIYKYTFIPQTICEPTYKQFIIFYRETET